MNVLLYAKNNSEPFELLQRVVSRVLSPNGFKIINSINALCQQFKNKTITQNNMTIAILFIDDHAELQDLLQKCNWLNETKNILILPDKEPETIKLAHTLFPRYLDFSDSNFTEIGAVLTKIKQSSCRK